MVSHREAGDGEKAKKVLSDYAPCVHRLIMKFGLDRAESVCQQHFGFPLLMVTEVAEATVIEKRLNRNV